MKKTLVIFDVDGTLVFSNRIDSHCFAQTYATIYQRPFPSIDWRNYPHVTDHTIFNSVIRQHFNRSATETEIGIFQDQFVQLIEEKRIRQPKAFNEVPNARSTIERLLDDPRYIVGIGTGGWQRPALVKLRHVAIPADRLLFHGADGKVTREAILDAVIKDAGKVDRVVYVGDAVWDVHTTRNMAINFIGIRRNGDLGVLKEAGSQTVLRDFSDYHVFEAALSSAQPPLPLDSRSELA